MRPEKMMDSEIAHGDGGSACVTVPMRMASLKVSSAVLLVSVLGAGQTYQQPSQSA